jgi:transposase-like protein
MACWRKRVGAERLYLLFAEMLAAAQRAGAAEPKRFERTTADTTVQPKAVMDEAEDDVLACMHFPTARRTKLHSTKPIERLNDEIKRRTDVVGIFPNAAAVVRLIGGILLEQSDEWATQRACYLTLETIGAVSDTATASPPAVAA